MIASGAPAWAVWLALGLWGVAICLLAFAFFAARSHWRKLKPPVAPYLAMLFTSPPDDAG